MNIILIWFAIKYKGNWDDIYKALEDKEKISLSELRSLEQRMKEEEINAITILDLEYPNQLKRAYKPPFVLFYQGNKKILNNSFICASGNELNDKVKTWIKKSSKDLTSCYTLVSSLYKGVDQFILKNAEKNNGNLLLVAANGLHEPFFASEVEPGEKILVVSEYPNGTHVSKERLRSRNRIIAAFADSLILYSSKKDGGIMNLVSHFLNQGKEIYCYPGDGGKEDGNSELIKQGANLITSIKEVNS